MQLWNDLDTEYLYRYAANEKLYCSTICRDLTAI